jgi:hypothetical protein
MVVIQSADAVIAIGGSHGALSEIAIALQLQKPAFGPGTWDIPGVIRCCGPEDAVEREVLKTRGQECGELLPSFSRL